MGAEIASLAAPAILIRDGNLLEHNIAIYEELDRLGGVLDGAGDPEHGYIIRGSRMFKSKYLCRSISPPRCHREKWSKQ